MKQGRCRKMVQDSFLLLNRANSVFRKTSLWRLSFKFSLYVSAFLHFERYRDFSPMGTSADQAKWEPSGDAVVGLFNTAGKPEAVFVPAFAIGLPENESGYSLHDLRAGETKTGGMKKTTASLVGFHRMGRPVPRHVSFFSAVVLNLTAHSG
jgi:hypothetical protein